MKCLLCEKKINWEHHLPPLPYLIVEKYCPDCWNRIWAEWYEYPDDSDYYDLCYASPSDEYIIKTYKGNDLVAKLEKNKPKYDPEVTCTLGESDKKKKHWWSR
jgi:hypothetical protein